VQTISEIRALLAERGLHPKHRMGQNFLHDQNHLRRLISAAEIRPGDLILEVGPGTGTLTEALLEAGADVIACELDRDLADLIHDRLDGRITLIRGDCLDKGRTLNPEIVAAIAGRDFKLVANLPYQIASPLMTALLIDHPTCRGQFITIQREVAERLVAGPSTKAYGPLSIIIQAFAEVHRIATLRPTCFWPPPKVDSAMVSILPSSPGRGSGGGGGSKSGGEGVLTEVSALSTADSRRAFARFVTELFMKRRKQLGTIFGRGRSFPAGITPDLRPEALSVERTIALFQDVTQRPSDAL